MDPKLLIALSLIAMFFAGLIAGPFLLTWFVRRRQSRGDSPDQLAHGDIPHLPFATHPSRVVIPEPLASFRDTTIKDFAPHSTSIARGAQNDHA
jgi:hypothetical protein